MEKFEKLGLKDNIVDAIEKMGFDEPTLVQELSIPLIMGGKDVMAQSATGSGKTLAFGAGIVENCKKDEGVQGLVLAPTRELAEQVREEVEKLADFKDLEVMSIYGGVSIKPQIKKLREAEVVSATPGRLLDHLNRGTIDLSNVKTLVLDEADRMLDMGFIDDVEKIIKHCRKDRQTLFFSATMPGEIQILADKHMDNPEEVWAEKMVKPEKLEQVYYDVPKNIKLSLLVHLLKEEDSDLVMVFCNTRRTTDFVAKNLKNQDINATPIHGGFSQNKRDRAMDKFNNEDKKTEVLVCTDVAARGLDINNVTHIYNYDAPNNPKAYVHRIGRTARAGKEGKVINLISPEDHENFRRVDEKYYDFEIKKVKTPYVNKIKIVTNKRGKGRKRRGKGRRNSKRRN